MLLSPSALIKPLFFSPSLPVPKLECRCGGWTISRQNGAFQFTTFHHFFFTDMASNSHFLRNVLVFITMCFVRGEKNISNLPPEASALLGFKSGADLQGELKFSPNTSFEFCKWEGIQCSGGRAVKVVIQSMNLGGIFSPNTLTELRQLRVLSLQNNSLTGAIPDLSDLFNLKVLFLNRNYFSGYIPRSVSTLHRLKTLDLSYNMLAGEIPISLNRLDRLHYLRLNFNRFNGSIPPLNQSTLEIFNVSHNDLEGVIPVTPTLSRFKTSSFALNSGLCGEIIHRVCSSTRPFFGSIPAPEQSPALSQTASFVLRSADVARKRKRAAFVIGFSLGVPIFVISLICFVFAIRKLKSSPPAGFITKIPLEPSVTANADAVLRIAEDNEELEEKVKRLQEGKQQRLQIIGKSGSLVFCAGDPQVYTLDQLMRASAELLGRGTMGTTYKAVLDSRLIVTVKRLDGGRMGCTSQETFEGHMESVGRLRHPNLVPLRAFFQAREERLLIYDYQPNGSLFSLIHGSKSSKSRPLHWTSCLKIAEDSAQGLCYIHQAWRLVHGNLKSSNVLLGPDFEACLTDYCLAALAMPSQDEDPNSMAYKSPEILKQNHLEGNSKSDVYSLGVLLIELLTGKLPSDHPNLMPGDMIRWMKSVRGEGSWEKRLEMLLEVAVACRMALPEQRPTMWQVLKMIQEIKEVEFVEDGVEST